jgi:hypothetical protein
LRADTSSCIATPLGDTAFTFYMIVHYRSSRTAFDWTNGFSLSENASGIVG